MEDVERRLMGDCTHESLKRYDGARPPAEGYEIEVVCEDCGERFDCKVSPRFVPAYRPCECEVCKSKRIEDQPGYCDEM